MIVRIWNARTTKENAPAYHAQLESSVFPVMRNLKGFVSAEVLEREDGGEVEIMVLSRWANMAAVRAFAGDAFEQAVVTPAARAALTSFDEQVSHYHVKAECKA
ncbi:MAG TPA: antibiotic biosynthesis monooxygenase [Caulobacterales bacterium]|nr:antibiotic biosynthesis monooxygenase [Caulobacterales bacterium]